MDRSLEPSAPLVLEKAPQPPRSESVALATGGIASLLAGACCVVPLVLVSVGVGGAWLANLQLLAPYRPVFIARAGAAIPFAALRRLCPPGRGTPVAARPS